MQVCKSKERCETKFVIGRVKKKIQQTMQSIMYLSKHLSLSIYIFCILEIIFVCLMTFKHLNNKFVYNHLHPRIDFSIINCNNYQFYFCYCAKRNKNKTAK